MEADGVSNKIGEIIAELKRTGLWKMDAPSWVTNYEGKIIGTQNDFAEWLQFTWLPNCVAPGVQGGRSYIVPQAVKFFGEDVRKGTLLQLLIELDAML